MKRRIQLSGVCVLWYRRIPAVLLRFAFSLFLRWMWRILNLVPLPYLSSLLTEFALVLQRHRAMESAFTGAERHVPTAVDRLQAARRCRMGRTSLHVPRRNSRTAEPEVRRIDSVVRCWVVVLFVVPKSNSTEPKLAHTHTNSIRNEVTKASKRTIRNHPYPIHSPHSPRSSSFIRSPLTTTFPSVSIGYFSYLFFFFVTYIHTSLAANDPPSTYHPCVCTICRSPVSAVL